MEQDKPASTKANYNNLVARLVSLAVGAYGVYIIAIALLNQFAAHRLHLVNSFTIDVRLLFGLGFIYLSLLLARRKRNALYLALGAFAFLLGEGATELFARARRPHVDPLMVVGYILLPIVIMGALLLTRVEFKVRSDQQTFTSSVKLAVLVLMITLVYGVSGFMLMDNSDFHQQIGFTSALHHTVDQFELTTSRPLHPYSKRARLFMDSLSFVSIAAVAVVVVSLFQPVRARLVDQSHRRERLRRLMERYGAPSEDFFKLWPRDKHYFFSTNLEAGLAYYPRRRVALVLADPVGDVKQFRRLMRRFEQMCWANDWQPALIHVAGTYSKLYKELGFQLQLIGQEAFVDTKRFCSVTANDKYFRNIKNRFGRNHFVFEILSPPHHRDTLERLKAIEQEWLAKPGRVERGFVMGYFSEEYLQISRLAVVRDATSAIQAFLNLVPTSSFNAAEATYDMLRSAADAPPNVNDFLFYELLHELSDEGVESFSLGLSPLVGLDEVGSSDNALIGGVLRFAYANGDRFYSFSGLRRFKAKYEPRWEDRYIGYKGGVRGFSRMLNALVLAMKVRPHLKR